MKRVMFPLTVVTCVLLLPSGAVLGANPHSPSNPSGPATGKPTQTCGVTTANTAPGNSVAVATSPGSAFNPNGVADAKYAGTQSNGNSINQAAQYDVACFQAP
jgi:hypothetical protein